MSLRAPTSLAPRSPPVSSDLVRELLPNGRDQSGYWRVGGLDGEKGGSWRSSCGSKQGLWIDHATEERGRARSRQGRPQWLYTRSDRMVK